MKHKLPILIVCIVSSFMWLLSSIVIASGAQTPNIPSSNYLVGTFYFPAWHLNTKELTYTVGWPSLENFPERKPILGYYDEGSPEVSDWEIKYAIEHGVNFFIFLWNRCDNLARSNYCNDVLGKPIETTGLPRYQALHNGFLQAQYRDKMKFAIMLIDGMPYSQSFSSLDDLKNNLMPFLINTYFKKPNYLVIDNKPVLYIFNPFDLEKITGSTDQAKEALRIMRQSVKDNGFTDLIIMGHDWQFVNRNISGNQKLKENGFDYSFSYVTPVVSVNGVNVGNAPTEQQAIDSQKQSYEYLAANNTLPFIITASPFWDSYPYNYDLDRKHWFTNLEGYKTVINNAKAIMSQESTDLTKRMIILDAWNEFGEGHYIAPDAKNGFMYLQAIRDTLTSQNNTPDERTPAQLGMGPYESLYTQYVQDHEREYAQVSTSTYTFTNPDEFIDVLDVGFITQNTDKLTFGGWVKPALTDTNYYPFAAPYRAAVLFGKTGDGHCVVATNNNAWYSTGTAVAWPTGKIIANEWHQIICVYDGSHLSVYVDGLKANTSTSAISGTIDKRPARLRLGYSITNWYPASIANFVFKNTALTDDQILSLYQTSKPTLVLGDLNNDNKIDIFDYKVLISVFGETGTLGFSPADLNKDGKVNIFDLNILVGNFGE